MGSDQEESLLPTSAPAQNENGDHNGEGQSQSGSQPETFRQRVHDMVRSLCQCSPTYRISSVRFTLKVEGELDTWFEFTLLGVIFINVLSLVVSTVRTGRDLPCIGTRCERLGDRYTAVFETIEWVSVSAFTLEWFMRIWACIEDPECAKKGPFWGRVRYALTFYPIVDVLSIMPNWLSLGSMLIDPLIPGTTSFETPNFTTAGRIVRLVRIFKTDKYISAFSLLGDVLYDNRILLTATSFYSMMVWIISGTLLYYTERNNRAEEMDNHFQSIPLSMFPTLLMLTGEFPLSDFTPLGQVVSCFIAIIAVAIFAVPTSILGSGFMQAVQKSQHRELTIEAD